MSLNQYHQLQQKSVQDATLVGNQLPELNTGQLNIDTKTLNRTEVFNYIKELKATESWIMLSDRIEINNLEPEQNYMIESEWCNANESLSVKLLQGDTYQVTHFVYEQSESLNQAFTEQVIYLRPELKGQTDANACRYRLWWKQVEKGEHQGRWVPLAQQFIGFTQAESIEKSSKGAEA